MKAIRCFKCGCERTLLIKAEVIETLDDGRRMKAKLKTLCMPCLLRTVELVDSTGREVLYSKAMGVVRHDDD